MSLMDFKPRNYDEFADIIETLAGRTQITSNVVLDLEDWR